MKAIIVKLPARYVVLFEDEGEVLDSTFARSSFQGAEFAGEQGVHEIEEGDLSCLSFTYTPASPQPSSASSSPKGSVPTSIRGGSTSS